MAYFLIEKNIKKGYNNLYKMEVIKWQVQFIFILVKKNILQMRK